LVAIFTSWAIAASRRSSGLGIENFYRVEFVRYIDGLAGSRSQIGDLALVVVVLDDLQKFPILAGANAGR